MYRIIRWGLFLFDPEKIHSFTTWLLKMFFKIPGLDKLIELSFCKNNEILETEVFGIKFPNPVGLAAGFDKNASLIDELSHFGFGFIEIGTVTPKPQSGNEKPRLFRLKKDGAIINRMGFNNEGLQKVIENLKKRNSKVIVGGNIGKNKITANENAIDDYLECFEALFNFVDYFVVNVSSPNTPNLRQLQEKEPLTFLLTKLIKANKKKENPKPILLKIAPDLTNNQLDDIIEIVSKTKISGIIATNTTIERGNLKTDTKKIGNGGLSGKPLKDRSTEVIRYLSEKSNRSFPIIGVGGIHSEQDAIEKLQAGAKLVQLYTGFIYEGPIIIKKINRLILKMRLQEKI